MSEMRLVTDNNKFDLVQKVYPNFIKNRFDVMYGNDFDVLEINKENKKMYIPLHRDGETMICGTALVPMELRVFDDMIDFLFAFYPQVNKMQFWHCVNKYPGMHTKIHWSVDLPSSWEEYLSKLSGRVRNEIKRYNKRVTEHFDYEFKYYKVKDLPKDIVSRYFEFKQMGRERGYGLTEEEYLEKYFVTDAEVLYLNGNMAAVNFLSIVGDSAYLENMASDPQYNNCYLGIVLFYRWIERLIGQGIKAFYLGGGDYQYKRHCASVKNVVYKGEIGRYSWARLWQKCLKLLGKR